MQTFDYATFLARCGHEDTLDDARRILALSEDGPWLVGGCVRRAVTGVAQDADYDVAFRSPDQREETVRRLVNHDGFKVVRETKFHIELCKRDASGTTVVQALRMTYGSPQHAIDTFDFTICQLLYDGRRLHCGDYTLWGLGRKKLMLRGLTYGVSTVRRLTKYANQGFTICQGTVVAILEAVAANKELIRDDEGYT